MPLANPPIRTGRWLGLLCALAFASVAGAEPPLPQTFNGAMDIARNVAIPIRADLIENCSLEDHDRLERRDTSFRAELLRGRNSSLRTFFGSRSPFDFQLATEIAVAKADRPGLPDRTRSVRKLSMFKPVERLILGVANASIKSADFYQWKLKFADSKTEADYMDVTVRRWIVEFGGLNEAASQVQAFGAEIQLEDENGRVFVVDVPMTEQAFKNRRFDVEVTRASWFGLADWRPRDTRHPDGVRALPQVRVRPEEPNINREGLTIFHSGIGLDFDKALVEMEEATHAFSAITLRQFRDLVRKDPKVRILMGRTSLTTSMHGRIVSYVVYRENDDHFEVLSAGCYPGFKDLGVTEQLLADLHGRLRGDRSFITINPPAGQRPMFSAAGFMRWPKDAIADEKWRDPHRGNAVAGADNTVPLSGEIPVFTGSADDGHVLFCGELPLARYGAVSPQDLRERTKPPTESRDDDFPEYVPDPVDDAEWPGNVKNWTPLGDEMNGALADSPSTDDDAYAFSDYNQDWLPEGIDVEHETRVIRHFQKLMRLYERAVVAKSTVEQAAVTDAVFSLYKRSDIQGELKRMFFFSIPFDAIVQFVKVMVRRAAKDFEMRRAVRSRVLGYGYARGTHDEAVLGRKLHSLMNDLRKVLRPEWPEFSVVSSRRMAEHFMNSGSFPRYDVDDAWMIRPRWEKPSIDPALTAELTDDGGQHLFEVRKSILTLKSLTVPPASSNPSLPFSVPNVLILNRSEDRRVYVAAGYLKVIAGSEPSAMLPSSPVYMWISTEGSFSERVPLAVVTPHLWTVPLLGSAQTVRIVPAMRGAQGIPMERPTAPLKVGYWLVDNVERVRQVYDEKKSKGIYLVLVCDDPKWNQVVVPSSYVEPTSILDLDALPPQMGDDLAANTPQPDCARIIENAGRVIHDHRLN